MSKRLILCDCIGSQDINPDALTDVCGLTCSPVYSNLCTTQLDKAASEISKGNTIIACAQERELFNEISDELGVPTLGYVDIRDRAGWTSGGDSTAAKMAALVNDALLEKPAEKTLDVESDGRCLILGPAGATLQVAEQLADSLAVTVLLDTASELPVDRRFDVVVGHMRKCSGTLGKYVVTIDALRQVLPGGRGEFSLSEPRDNGQSECDVILDLTGEPALFSHPESRDGYLRADPRDPPSVARAAFQAAQYIGTFEKPLYVNVDPILCAHSRSAITGCSKCIEACETGAISPSGDHISVDPLVCAGCSDCVSVCPSGAITYDAPPTEFQFKRIETLARSYRKLSQSAPRLLVHDSNFGAQMIAMSARFGRGLPADVIPLETTALAGFGHAEMLAALGCGFSRVDILLSPKFDQTTTQSEYILAATIAGDARICLISPVDPDDLEARLWTGDQPRIEVEPILPMGSRRQVARLSASALNPDCKVPIPLPENAPYGAVAVDPVACTLCLACVAQCPAGALGDNPDTPQLRFQENACLQCGLCTRVCPEDAISLVPQLDLSDAALNQIILYEEDPFECIECGTPFGVKSTVEKISAQLTEKHPMFATTEAGRMIKMCEKCRIQVQYQATDNPFQGGERPRTVTTEDYLSKRRDH